MRALTLHLALLAVGVVGFTPAARPVGPCRSGSVQCRLNTGGKGPLKMAGAEGEAAPAEIRKGRFLAYVKSEDELEKWKKANPIDPVEKLKGPLTSVAILTAGFYTIVRRPAALASARAQAPRSRPPTSLPPPQPIVRGIADGVREGDIVGALARELADPSGSLNPAPAVSAAADQIDAGVLQSIADAISSGP